MLSQTNMDKALELMLTVNNNRNSNNTNTNKKHKDPFFCNKPALTEPNENNTPVETMYTPNKTDSLFWCFYIIKYGC